MFDYSFKVNENKINIFDGYGCQWHPEVEITTSVIYEKDGSFAEPKKVFDRILKLVYGNEYPLADMASDVDAERYDLITTRLAINAKFNIMAKIPHMQLLKEIVNSINNKIDSIIDEIGL